MFVRDRRWPQPGSPVRGPWTDLIKHVATNCWNLVLLLLCTVSAAISLKVGYLCVSTMQYKEQALVLWVRYVRDSQVNLQEPPRDHWHHGSYVLWICRSHTCSYFYVFHRNPFMGFRVTAVGAKIAFLRWFGFSQCVSNFEITIIYTYRQLFQIANRDLLQFT